MTETIGNSKAAFVFPGIGIELCGHENMLYKKYQSLYSPFFREGSASAECDLEKALLLGSVDQLGERKSQLFTYCFSAGTSRVLAENGLLPSLAAGYSFGIYAALYATGALTFSEGLKILDKAYTLVAMNPLSGKTDMIAIIGLSLSDIRSVIEKEQLHSVFHINSNNEFCHIFCSNIDECTVFSQKSLEADAVNAVNLKVSLPYHHSSLADTVGEPFGKFLDSCSWHTPCCPIASTRDQHLLTSPDELKRFVVQHLYSPINWLKTVEKMYTGECAYFIECGPGISLTQNARFIPGQAKWVNCKNSEKRLGI